MCACYILFLACWEISGVNYAKELAMDPRIRPHLPDRPGQFVIFESDDRELLIDIRVVLLKGKVWRYTKVKGFGDSSFFGERLDLEGGQ